MRTGIVDDIRAAFQLEMLQVGLRPNLGSCLIVVAMPGRGHPERLGEASHFSLS